MRIVLLLGGSVLTFDRIEKLAEVIREISKANEILVVTGGGPIARDYIKTARGLGADEATCDALGIDFTRLNARLLIAALPNAYPAIPKNYDEAKAAFLSGRTVVMGGITPAQTTDAVAAVLAERVGADLIINATSVNGVYDSDPAIDIKARKYEKLTHKQLLDIAMKTETRAGSKSAMDHIAAKILERSKVPMIVVDGRDERNIMDAVKGKHGGTEIVSESP